ncbi:MAG: glycosyltransferase family 39 protein [Myxococcota bacterium]
MLLMALDNPRFARWGVPVALVVGALVLFVGIGRTGLWEPWEMDRADLARTLVEPDQAVVAVSRGGEDALRETVEEAAEEAGVAARFAAPPSPDARGVSAGARTVREALDRARSEVVAAIVLDRRLFLADPESEAAWSRAWQVLDEAAAYVPNGRLVVLMAGDDLDADLFRSRLAAARFRAGWAHARAQYDLPEGALPGATEPAWGHVAEGAEALPNLLVVEAPDTASVASALEEASDVAGWTVRFKDRGETYTLPPLRHWVTAALYEAFGISELTSRLGGALLAFLALLALVLGARRHYGPRVATLAGLVCATTPLFFAQARSVMGEPGVILGVTLVGVGLLEQLERPSTRRVWLLLLGGAVVTFLAKGLGGLAICAIMAGGVALVLASPRPRDWAPAATLAALFGVAAWWVLTNPADAWPGQFRFTQPMFTEGPTAYQRNFDYALKRIGFGSFPWGPLYVVAMGGMVWRAARDADRHALALVFWFAVPSLAVMGFLKDFNFALWPAAPAAALGVALVLDQLVTRGAPSRVVGFLILLATLILWKELKDNPQPLADFLTIDPPFADKAGQRFPEGVSLPSGVMAVVFALVALALVHFTQLVSGARRVAGFFRRPRPYAIALGALAVLLPLSWFIRVLGKYRVGMKLETAGALAPHQRRFASQFLLGLDPMVVLAWASLALVASVLVVRWGAPALQRWIDRTFRSFERPVPVLSWLGRATLALGRLLRLLLVVPVRIAGGHVVRLLARVPPVPAHRVGAGAFVVLGVVMLASVTWPEGYWSETLGHPALAAVLVAALGAGIAGWRLGRGPLDGALGFLAVLGLFLGTRLSRDASLVHAGTVALTALGWLAYARLVAPRLWRDGADFARWGGLLASASLFAWTIPLLERWDHMTPLLYPEAAESLTRYLLVESRVTALFVGLLVLLVANAQLPRRVTSLVRRVAEAFERGPVAAASLLGAGLVFAGLTAAAFYPTMAEHVSQKHIVDTYREAEGLSGLEMGDRIFKHGSFGAGGRGDANFYTAGIPEIRDRDSALKVLLAEADEAASVETAEGTEVRVLPGWSDANDPDGDGVRDWEADRGIFDDVGRGRAVDESRSWEPDALKGRLLVDAAGRSWTITGNDATTVRFEGSGEPRFFAGRPERNRYAVDAPEAPDHQATAPEEGRYYVMFPAEGFSDINHAFRRLSGGRHIPILDGRSSRVLLATSRLREGEEQQNRYALHTMDREALDALEDPAVHRGWANFDDKIRVLGYKMDDEVVSKGKKFKLTLYFEALSEIRSSYKIFMHIDRTGTSNRIHGDHWPLNLDVGGESQDECVGCYRTDHWMPGDVIVDEFEGEVPIGTPSGPQDIWLGFFKPGAGKRLPVKDWEEGRVAHDGQNRVRIGTFQVR